MNTTTPTTAELALLGCCAVALALRTLLAHGLALALLLAGEFGRPGAYAFSPTTDALPTVSRGGQKNTVGSVGSVGSEALACEDPERNDYLNPSNDHTSDTTDTTDGQIESPARGAAKPSEVEMQAAGAPEPAPTPKRSPRTRKRTTTKPARVLETIA